MIDHVVVGRRCELIRVKVLNHAPLPSGANTLLACLSLSVNLNMNHVMLLLPTLGVVVGATDEHEVSRLHLLLGQSDWQTVKLVGLIPAVELESKFIPEIVNDLPNEGAAVKIEWGLKVLLTLFPIASSIRDTKILLRSLNELLSQSLFEVWVFPVRKRLLADVVTVLDVLLLCIPESLKVLL